MVDEVEPAVLKERLSNGASVQIIDVRHPQHFELAHIPGAENVPFPQLIDRIDEVNFGEYVVCVCPHGESSLQAARLIESYEGFPADASVANLVDGLEAWDGDLVSEVDSDSHHEAPF